MRILFFVVSLSVISQAFAHQPVMDMAPRWNGGYGIQTRVEYANSETETWVEGVYTFKPSVRMTLKAPFKDGKLGDAIFAVPLKRYTNRGAFTSNWGVTPSVRMPTGDGNDWDPGLSMSYSSEQPRLYQFYDLYHLGDDNGLDINIGLVNRDGKGSSTYYLLDISAKDTPSGDRVLSGPIFVYFKRNVVFRAEYKFDVYDNDDEWEGNFASLGIGIVY